MLFFIDIADDVIDYATLLSIDGHACRCRFCLMPSYQRTRLFFILHDDCRQARRGYARRRQRVRRGAARALRARRAGSRGSTVRRVWQVVQVVAACAQVRWQQAGSVRRRQRCEAEEREAGRVRGEWAGGGRRRRAAWQTVRCEARGEWQI